MNGFADWAGVVALGTAIMVLAMLATRRIHYVTTRWCWVLIAMSGFTAVCLALTGRWPLVAAWTFTTAMWGVSLIAAHHIERSEREVARH